MMHNNEENTNKYITYVKFDDLYTLKNEMTNIVEECKDIVKTCYILVDDTQKNYITPTGTYFRERANDDIFKFQKYVEVELANYLDELNSIIETYTIANEHIKSYIMREN